MYIFLLVVFLAQSPYPTFSVIGNYNTKADCKVAQEYVQSLAPQENKDDVFCMQVVDQNKIVEI